MHNDTKCYWLPFWLHLVFWLSRKAVTIFAVDRHPGVTRIFDASLNYRQPSIIILLDPSMVAIKQIVLQLTRMCQEIWHDQGELWKQCLLSYVCLVKAWHMRCLMPKSCWRIWQKLAFAGFGILSHAGFTEIATIGGATTESCMLDWGIWPTCRQWESLHVRVFRFLLLIWMFKEIHMYQLVLHELEQDTWPTVDPGAGVQYMPTTKWQLKQNKVDECNVKNLWEGSTDVKKSGKRILCQTLWKSVFFDGLTEHIF
jgi:hypothetical protein